MNPITLTADLVRCVDLAYPDNSRSDVPMMQKAIPGLPLLTYDFGKGNEQADNKIREQMLQDWGSAPPTPFPSFRFYVRNNAAQQWGVVDRQPRGLRALVVCEDGARRRLIVKLYVNPTNRPGMDWNARAFNWDTGKEITRGVYGADKLPEPLQSHLDFIVSMQIGTICVLSREYMAPGVHVATVKPDGKGRSVEWLKAREHYTIIHRTHAANTVGVAEGSTVAQDPSKHLTRIAHSRRAHDRILRSDRFKAMRGKTIKIASQWVGPKEWKDTAGQVYRIAELPKIL